MGAIESIESVQDAIAAACRRHRVVTLKLFGSAATADFDEQRSDFDFLVKFDDMSASEHADAYFGLLNDLEKLLGRKIDLVEEAALTNPWLIRSVRRSQRVIYEAA